MMPLFLILLTVPTVSLFKLFTEPRVGKVQLKRLEEDSRGQRNCRHIYSLLADAAATAVDMLHSLPSWLTQHNRHNRDSAVMPPCSSEVSVAQSCPTLWDTMDCGPQGSSVHGSLQARILKWIVISFSRDLPHPGIKPGSPTLQADSLLSEPPGKPPHSR